MNEKSKIVRILAEGWESSDIAKECDCEEDNKKLLLDNTQGMRWDKGKSRNTQEKWGQLRE